MQVNVVIDQRVRALLDRATPAQLKPALRRAARIALRPTLAAAKARTPVRTGRLKNSLGIVTNIDGRTGTFLASIEPRRTFTYRHRGARWRVSAKSKSVADRIKLRARGILLDGTQPSYYGLGVESGVKRDGTKARAAGGAWMLRDGLAATHDDATRVFGAELLAHLAGSAPSI